VQQPLVGQNFPITVASRSHSDTPHSVGLLWKSDQPDAKTSTWQLTTPTTDIHAPGGIRIHDGGMRTAAEPRLRPRGHWIGLSKVGVREREAVAVLFLNELSNGCRVSATN